MPPDLTDRHGQEVNEPNLRSRDIRLSAVHERRDGQSGGELLVALAVELLDDAQTPLRVESERLRRVSDVTTLERHLEHHRFHGIVQLRAHCGHSGSRGVRRGGGRGGGGGGGRSTGSTECASRCRSSALEAR